MPNAAVAPYEIFTVIHNCALEAVPIERHDG